MASTSFAFDFKPETCDTIFASREGLTPSPTCQNLGKVVSRRGDAATSATKRVARIVSPPRDTDGGIFMARRKSSDGAAAGSADLTSAGVPWSEVPDFALAHVEWMDGRHGGAKPAVCRSSPHSCDSIFFSPPTPRSSSRHEGNDRRQRRQVSAREMPPRRVAP